MCSSAVSAASRGAQAPPPVKPAATPSAPPSRFSENAPSASATTTGIRKISAAAPSHRRDMVGTRRARSSTPKPASIAMQKTTKK